MEYNQAQEQQTVGDQHHEGGEKKSVMRKMKDKAKKITEAIKNHGQHGHDQESDEMKTPPDNHDLDEEDADSDEENFQDPAVQGPTEIHGPPMYESGAGTGARRSQPEELSRPGVADERRSEGKGKGGDLGRTGEFLETPPVQSFQRQGAPPVESPEQRNVHLEIPRGMEEDHAANTDRTSNYQSKVTDPAAHGRPEAPMYESVAGTGAQTRQLEVLSRPRNADEHAFLGGEGKGKGGDLGRTPQNTAVPSSQSQEVTFAPATATVESPDQRKVDLEIPRGMEEDLSPPTANTDQTSNYQSKVSDPTGRGEEVRDITPMIQSFEKLGTRDEQNRGEKESMSAEEFPEKESMSAGELLESHDQFKPEPATSPEQVVENSESERQEEKSPRQGGYMSAIASTAASLRTSLMSRVVGSGTATETETTRPDTDNLQESGGVEPEPEPKQSSVAESVKEKIGGPVEEKGGPGGAGTAKIVGPGNQTSQETMELDSGAEGDEMSGEGKGMPLSSYLSEKLKPGEEDAALSEVISEKLMKNREETHEDGEEGSDDPVKGGMVDKLRGAVGSWFSNPGQPHDSVTQNDAAEQKMGLGEEEKQLQKKPGN